MVAFRHDIYEPSWKPDTRVDTVWRDSLHIDALLQVPYTHFLPDDVTLLAFTQTQTDRYLLKTERKDANHPLLAARHNPRESRHTPHGDQLYDD